MSVPLQSPRWRLRTRLVGVLVAALAATMISAAGIDVLDSSIASAATTISVSRAGDIQPAIDSLKSSGGAVHIVAGRYELPAKIRVYSNITVFGDGMGQTVLVPGPGMDDHLMADNSARSRDTNIVIRDLTLDGLGRRSSKSGCCHGLRLVNQTNTVVERVESKDNSRDGFYLGYYQNNDFANARLSGCRATGNGRNGIALTHGQNNVIEYCVAKNNNRFEAVAGIDLEPDQGLNVSDNKLRYNKANRQNVGVQLYSAERSTYRIANNAMCYNKAK